MSAQWNNVTTTETDIQAGELFFPNPDFNSPNSMQLKLQKGCLVRAFAKNCLVGDQVWQALLYFNTTLTPKEAVFQWFLNVNGETLEFCTYFLSTELGQHNPLL